MVFHRPARIAYETRLSRDMTPEQRRTVQDDIMRVLSVTPEDADRSQETH